MSKLKTHSGAKKRFLKEGRKYRRAFRNHILTKKSTSRKRRLRAMGRVHHANAQLVARMLKRKGG